MRKPNEAQDAAPGYAPMPPMGACTCEDCRGECGNQAEVQWSKGGICGCCMADCPDVHPWNNEETIRLLDKILERGE